MLLYFNVLCTMMYFCKLLFQHCFIFVNIAIQTLSPTLPSSFCPENETLCKGLKRLFETRRHFPPFSVDD